VKYKAVEKLSNTFVLPGATAQQKEVVAKTLAAILKANSTLWGSIDD
jgi:hypothetical protein